MIAISGEDVWHLPSFAHLQDSLSFSWGFRRQGGRLLERLDRFYVDATIAQHGGLTSIVPGTALSDHAPVALQILFEGFSGPRRDIGIPDSVF